MKDSIISSGHCPMALFIAMLLLAAALPLLAASRKPARVCRVRMTSSGRFQLGQCEDGLWRGGRRQGG